MSAPESSTRPALEAGSFGAVLRRLRLDSRMSQEELAERASLSVESISALERGRRRAPYRETVRLLAQALNLNERQRAELEAAAGRAPGPAIATIVHDSADDRSRAMLGALHPVETIRHNLPLQRTTLVGRDADVARVVTLIRGERLVTITGAGGIGKTRVALRAADAVVDTAAAGVWLVELAGVAQPDETAAAVARVLNVQEQANRPLLDTLRAFLKHREVIVVLDNCEHVVNEAAALCDALLQSCPRLRILATSRESLRIDGERIHRLPPLSVPAIGRAGRLRAADAGAYTAIVLFVERAQRSDHAFVLDDDTAPIVAEICARLDGIPLAIELAAARVNVLPPRELLAKLDQRFRILTGGDRTALPRQQTMRALIDWSYDLLSRSERRVFEQLAIFAGGTTLAAMTAVLADDTFDDVTVFDLLSSLVDKSLVVVDHDVPQTRYRLLESSRQYAHAKLALRGDLTAVARRHAEAYVALAERMEREHDVARNSEWFARAALEIENWRAALHWTLVERGDVVLGQRLVGAMRAVWPASAIAERRRWLQLARESVDERTPPLVAAHLEHAVATVAYLFGEFGPAFEKSRRLADVYATLGDPLGVARAQFIMGRSLANIGNVADGEPLLRQSLKAARALGNTPLAGLALAGLARSRQLAGDITAARAHLAEAFAIYDATGADAYSVLVESAAAGIEFRAGDGERAIALSLAALSAMRRFGLTLFVTMELNALAMYLLACDRAHEASAAAREALIGGRETQQLVEVAWALQHLAGAMTLPEARPAPLADVERAARVIGYVDARIAALGATRQPPMQHEYERIRASVSVRLGSAAAREASAGAALSEDQAIAATETA